MEYYLPFRTQYIPSAKQAAVPQKGTAACFYSTKSEQFSLDLAQTGISKSVDKGLSWLKMDKLRENWAKSLLSLVIIVEGQIKTLRSREVTV